MGEQFRLWKTAVLSLENGNDHIQMEGFGIWHTVAKATYTPFPIVRRHLISYGGVRGNEVAVTINLVESCTENRPPFAFGHRQLKASRFTPEKDGIPRK